MENNSSYRIHTNIGQDSVIRVQLKQDIDTFEILSLKLTQEDTYRLHTSNYGVVIGRVLANDAFGIPNAKVSIFVPIDDEDGNRIDITNLYDFKNIRDLNEKGLPYNLLPSKDKDICHQAIGSFPDKLTVLDNDIQIEVFDKYYKYTTVTNQCGDYMIFGVPCGSQTVHVDVDLSDIGVLSQKPRDMVYQGYDIAKFENSNQFRASTNLDDLPQIKRQDATVQVYPFWGDEDEDEIAITRQDLKIPYDFKPTCVFMGCIVSDDYSNAIGHNCKSSIKAGYNSKLIANLGTIEMIRKTPDGLVEEYPIPQTDQIDGDGVWCFQIPMNLDYIGMDEYGNIIPTDDPSKGIPTRTSVRFRFSVQETQNEGVSRHRAKHLVPSLVPMKEGTSTSPKDEDVAANWYTFGSGTPDDYFRDLFWNKVYSVKSYIPRIQKNKDKSDRNYSALRSTNLSEGNNPMPFNSIRIRLGFVYMFICLLLTVVTYILTAINALFSGLYNALNAIANICIKIPLIGKICLFKPLVAPLMKVIPKCIKFNFNLDNQAEGTCYVPGCCGASGRRSCARPECNAENLIDNVQSALAQEFDITNLDLSNDWINGTLYFPLWYWKKTKKQKFLFGLITKRAKNEFCDCATIYNKLYVAKPCAIPNATRRQKGDYHREFQYHTLKHGVIKQYTRQDGLNVYYYSPYDINGATSTLLYATDLILLGSFNDCDIDGLPKFYAKLPSTTVNVPYMSPIITVYSDNGQSEDALVEGTVEFSGMDATRTWDNDNPKSKKGLFFDLSCTDAKTFEKACFNVGRMSELGVGMDGTFNEVYAASNSLTKNTVYADGMITKFELVDVEARSMFASLNHNGLRSMKYNSRTNYPSYKLKYIYTTDFDGSMANYAITVAQNMFIKTYDEKDDAYMWFRYGQHSDDWNSNNTIKSYNKTFPITHNSFYFYFGLKDGSTAIDKFNAKYGVECKKKTRQNIIYSIDTKSSEWCIDEGAANGNGLGSDNEYGRITIKFTKIAMPYSYTLYDASNNSLYHEDNVVASAITWYGNGNEKADDTVTSTTVAPIIGYDSKTWKEIGGIPITNQVYKLNVTDANGYLLSETIQLDGIGLTLNVEASPLGAKFYEGISQPSDFCDSLGGKITISSVFVDGQEYAIQGVATVQGKDGEYTLNLSLVSYTEDENGDVAKIINGNKTASIKLTIKPFSTKGFKDYCCGDANYNKKDNTLTWSINQPMDFEIKATQLCNGNENDNIYLTSVKVENGEVFNAYLNSVPLAFLGTSFTINTTSKTEFTSDWFELHNPSKYSFYQNFNTLKGIAQWSDFLSIFTENDSSNWDTDSKYAVAEYVLKSIGSICSSLYITESSNAQLIITSTGGQQPILLNSASPNYAILSEDTCMTSPINEYAKSASGYVIIPNEAPNIIGHNYLTPSSRASNEGGIMLRHVMNGKDITERIHWNKLYNLTYNRNYFAAFSNNGGYTKVVTEGISKCKSSSSYIALPAKSKPCVSPCGSDSNNAKFDNYISVASIDRRLDYVLFVQAPLSPSLTNFQIAPSNNQEDSSAWKKGVMLGTIINGVAMGYDENYNIVGDRHNPSIVKTKDDDVNTSVYEYIISDDGKLEYNTLCTNKKLYISSIDYNGGSLPINLTFKDFNKAQYPTNALVNVSGIPSVDSISINLTNCSYEFDPSVEYSTSNESVEVNNDTTNDTNTAEETNDLANEYLKCIVTEGDECSVDLDFKAPININPTNCYVAYQRDGNVPKKYEGFTNFQSVGVKAELFLKPDSVNSTHLVVNLAPVLIKASNKFRTKSSDGSKNVLASITAEFAKGNFNYLPKQFYEKGFDYFFRPDHDSYEGCSFTAKLFYSIKEKSGFIGNNIFYNGAMDETLFQPWNWSSITQNPSDTSEYPKHVPLHNTEFGYASCPTCVRWKSKNGPWYLVDDDSNEIYDASDERSTKVKWTIAEFNPRDKHCDVYAIMSQRLYLNDSNDNLTKEILVTNFSTIIDCRQIMAIPCGLYKTQVFSKEEDSSEPGAEPKVTTIDIEYFIIGITVPMEVSTGDTSTNGSSNEDESHDPNETPYVYNQNSEYSDYSYNMQLLGDATSPFFNASGYVTQIKNNFFRQLRPGAPLENIQISEKHPMENIDNWQNKDLISKVSGDTNIVYVSFSLPQGYGCSRDSTNNTKRDDGFGLVDNYYQVLPKAGPDTFIRLDLSNSNGFPLRLGFRVEVDPNNKNTPPRFKIS